MATTPSIKVVKTFTFKDNVSYRWSNRYHFNGGTPADSSHWTTLSNAVVTAEKAALSNANTIVETLGYAAGSDVPVFSATYTTVGTITQTGRLAPGEVVKLLRWSTAARTTKNHPIYLFNYYHGVQIVTDPAHPDTLLSSERTGTQTYAAAWIAGFSDGTHTCVRAGPNGATATGYFVEEFVTHRDFPYSPSA